MKKIKKSGLALIIASALLFQSCIGSFSLTNKILDFNRGVGEPIVQEIVFLAFIIVPVYGVSAFADAVIFNTIEFWTGDNPVAAKEFVNEKGEMVKINKTQDGIIVNNVTSGENYHIEFDKEGQSVYLKTACDTVKIMDYHLKNKTVQVYYPDFEAEYNLNNTSVLDIKNDILHGYTLAFKH